MKKINGQTLREKVEGFYRESISGRFVERHDKTNFLGDAAKDLGYETKYVERSGLYGTTHSYVLKRIRIPMKKKDSSSLSKLFGTDLTIRFKPYYERPYWESEFKDLSLSKFADEEDAAQRLKQLIDTAISLVPRNYVSDFADRHKTAQGAIREALGHFDR